jgi:hypothetical protein
MRASGLEPPVSEAELHGFVDGGLDRGRREAVEAFLADSPVDAARVATWRRQNERIRAAFASMESTPLPWASPLIPSTSGEARPASGQGEACGRSYSWREHWFARSIGLAFASGVLLTAGAAYFAERPGGGQGERDFRRAGDVGAADFRSAARCCGSFGKGTSARAKSGGTGIAESSARRPQACRRPRDAGRPGPKAVPVLYAARYRHSRALRRKNARPERFSCPPFR